MERVRFGRTELQVSRIAFGGIPIMRLPLEDAVEIVREALRLGINFIDTANSYTDSEIKIGAAIRGIPRDELIIATKSGAKDKQTLSEHLDKSLRQLGVEHIDIYQLHNITAEKRHAVFAPGGAYEGLLEAIQAGKVRFPAFSSHSIDTAIDIMKENRFDVVQLAFNYIDTMAAAVAIPLAKDLDMGFLSMKPMGGGMLYDAGLSFRYLMQYDSIVPDPGIEKIEEIREIVAIISERQALTDDDKARIEQLRAELGDTWCHRCDYCQPCLQGIPINTALSTRSFLRRTSIEGAMAWTGQAIELAKGCTQCRECMARCPYGLDIPTLLKERIAFWEEHAR